MSRPASPRRTVAVIGTGIAGLTVLGRLSELGLDVRGFDKGRGAGGRASTRRTGEYHFDHGAQYFTVRDPRFRAIAAGWLREGIVAPWRGSIQVLQPGEPRRIASARERLVGVPGMSAIARHLAGGLRVDFGVRVTGLRRDASGWCLLDAEGAGLGTYDRVVVATPPEQAAELLESVPDLARQARGVASDPCWAVLAAFERPVLPGGELVAAFVESSPLSWIACNRTKPGRRPEECWVLHGSADWSRSHVEEEPQEVQEALLDALFRALDLPRVAPIHAAAHRWRFARAREPLQDGCLWDGDSGVGVVGDWCHGTRIEGAVLSGLAVAERIIDAERVA